MSRRNPMAMHRQSMRTSLGEVPPNYRLHHYNPHKYGAHRDAQHEAATRVDEQNRYHIPIYQEEPCSGNKGHSGYERCRCHCFGGKCPSFCAQRLALPDNGTETGKDFRDPATRLPLQHKTYNKEAKIGYSDSIRGALQRVFYVDTDLYLTEHAPEFHADRRGDLASRQFDRLEHRHPGSDSADNQIECIGEDLQKT